MAATGSRRGRTDVSRNETSRFMVKDIIVDVVAEPRPEPRAAPPRHGQTTARAMATRVAPTRQ